MKVCHVCGSRIGALGRCENYHVSDDYDMAKELVIMEMIEREKGIEEEPTRLDNLRHNEAEKQARRRK